MSDSAAIGRRECLKWMATGPALLGLRAVAQPADSWKAGVSKIAITPREPIWMAGYGARTRPSEGVLQDIYVKSLAL